MKHPQGIFIGLEGPSDRGNGLGLPAGGQVGSAKW